MAHVGSIGRAGVPRKRADRRPLEGGLGGNRGGPRRWGRQLTMEWGWQSAVQGGEVRVKFVTKPFCHKKF